ncbi:MAG: transcription antitermination protein NusB [Clostridia bacterium]|nr:transcription antitermination protein NusB [Clostridia bacterium]
MSRRAARAKALQALFQVDLGHVEPEQALAYVFEEEALPPSAAEFARRLVYGSAGQMGKLDAIIERYAIGWRVERLAAVDRNILRLALYEMLYLKGEIPPSVTINEAVELAKTFNDDEAAGFVNALLDSVRKDLEAGILAYPGERES